MNNKNKSSKTHEYVRTVCPGKTEEDLVKAEENLQGLLLVVKEICDRLSENSQQLEVDKSHFN